MKQIRSLCAAVFLSVVLVSPVWSQTTELSPAIKIGAVVAEQLRTAELAYQSADLQEARVRFEAIAELLPADPTAFFRLGLIHQQLGQLDQSLSNYGRATAVVKTLQVSAELTELEQKIRFNRSAVYLLLARADLATAFDQLDARFTEAADRQGAQLDKLLGNEVSADRSKKAAEAGATIQKKDVALDCLVPKATPAVAASPASAKDTKVVTQTTETFVGGGVKK